MAGLESVDLNLLVSLTALLEEKHVTNAGIRIHVGQSAMSGNLRRLREHFGDELLVRVGTELQLTPFAEGLVPAARAAYEAASTLFASAAEFDLSESERVFSVSLSDYAMTILAGPLMERVDAATSRVRVSFEAAPASLVRDPDAALLQHDVVILPTDYLPGYVSSSLPLFQDDFVVVMWRSNSLATNGTLTVEDLAQAPMAVAALAPRAHQRPLAGLVAHNTLAVVEPHVFTSSYLALSHIIRGSRHWALVPRSLAEAFASDGELTFRTPPFPSEVLDERAFWHPSRERDAGLTWLRGALADIAATLRE